MTAGFTLPIDIFSTLHFLIFIWIFTAMLIEQQKEGGR